MEADTPTAQRWELGRERLDERQRRAFAAATSVARNTIMAGMQELKGLINAFVPGAAWAPVGSTRRGGSKGSRVRLWKLELGGSPRRWARHSRMTHPAWHQ